MRKEWENKENKKPVMKDWKCKACGHEVMAYDRPEPMKWTDGHVCYFVEMIRGEE